MTGLSNYSSNFMLDWVTGQRPFPTAPAVYLALFTVVGTDAGTGFTEVSGGAYARVQVAGPVATTGTTSNTSNVLTMAVPSWVQVGMTAYDLTNTSAITSGQTVTAINSPTNTQVTLSANVNATVGTGDQIQFSAFTAPTGTAPSQSTNNCTLTFPQASANWGTVVAFGLYDASTSGDLLLWDFMGNFAWLPCSVTLVGSGNGGVFSTHAHGYANGDPVVVTAEYGGQLPTVTQGSLVSYQQNFAANISPDTFTLSSVATGQSSANAVWTSSSGDLLARKITQQIIPTNVTASFASSTLTINVA